MGAFSFSSKSATTAESRSTIRSAMLPTVFATARRSKVTYGSVATHINGTGERSKAEQAGRDRWQRHGIARKFPNQVLLRLSCSLHPRFRSLPCGRGGSA